MHRVRNYQVIEYINYNIKSVSNSGVYTTPKRPHPCSQWMEVLLRRCGNCVLTDPGCIWWRSFLIGFQRVRALLVDDVIVWDCSWAE